MRVRAKVRVRVRVRVRVKVAIGVPVGVVLPQRAWHRAFQALWEMCQEAPFGEVRGARTRT